MYNFEKKKLNFYVYVTLAMLTSLIIRQKRLL